MNIVPPATFDSKDTLTVAFSLDRRQLFSPLKSEVPTESCGLGLGYLRITCFQYTLLLSTLLVSVLLSLSLTKCIFADSNMHMCG